MSRGRLLKGGMWLSAGNGLSAVFSFLRNIAIARLISVEDFGIVVLLSLIVAAVETISNLAIDRLLVQAPDGDDPELQATAHMLQVARGIIGALLVFFTATMLAALFKVPQAGWAFQTLALAPLIRSLAHLDTVRLQREMVFQPTFWGVALPAGLSLGLAVPLAYWLRDYSVIVWATLLQVLAQTVISHLLASRPYRWAWNRAVATRILSFGWPLLANGLLMFAVFQGDKAIIAVAFTPEVVGWYGAAFMLTLTPALFVTSVIQSLLLPLLSRHQNASGDFWHRSNQTEQLCFALGFLIAVVFLALGPELLLVLFGSRYRDGAVIVMLLGLAQGFRVAKAGQFLSSVALARTTDPLVANIVRGAALLAAVLLVASGFGPFTVALTGIVGEFASYLVAVFLLAKSSEYATRPQFFRSGATLVMLALSIGMGTAVRDHVSTLAYLVAGFAWIMACTAAMAALSPALRAPLVQMIRKKQKDGAPR
jgi:O-antigen/teichoic acid export membrane protein